MQKVKTIEKVVDDGLCTGCGTCAGICPKDALEMIIDKRKGIYIPRLNEDLCSSCAICYEVCPGHSVDFRLLNKSIFRKEPEDAIIGNYLNCYTGYATDYDIRYNSASGGLVTALLIFALEQGIIDGAMVTRMKKDKPLEPEPFIARTKEEIISARGSKYCPVPSNIALKEILKEEGNFAVVGLPCHIHGIRKAEEVNKKLKDRIVLHIGIFCSNSNSFHMTDFILQHYSVRKENVTQIDYRGEGWPGSMTIRIKDGVSKLIPYNDYIVYHEFGLFTPRRCAVCYDTTGELADISFGDAWGFHELAQDKVGKSLVISRSKVGEDCLQKAASDGDISLERISHNRAYGGNKRANLKAKFFFNRLVRKQIPTYTTRLEKPKLASYPYYLVLYLNMYLSTKKILWRLIAPLSYMEKALIRRWAKPS